MLRKLTVSLLFISLLLSQAMVSTSQQVASDNFEAINLAAMLPDSDIAVTMDFDRTLNVAAPGILNMDAKKIEHLNDLLKTIENQIGINPREIRQIAAGFNMPPDLKDKEFISKLNPTVILRTQNSNANLLDSWSQKLNEIIEFSSEKEPTRRYMEAFKEFRDFKPENTTPEKISTVTQKLTESLKKSQDLNAAINAVPKLNTDQAAINKLREANKQVAASLNRYLSAFKADTDMKFYRENSIRLLNRWNNITVTDPQRKQKLDAILQESKSIYKPFRKKYNDAQLINDLLNPSLEIVYPADPAKMDTADTIAVQEPVTDKTVTTQFNAELDAVTEGLKKLPAARLKRTDQLNSFAGSLENAGKNADSLIEVALPTEEKLADTDLDKMELPPMKKDEKTLSELMKAAQSESTVNNKKLLIFSLKQLADTLPKDKPAEPNPNKDAKPEPDYKIAVGFLDDRTMAIGFEDTVTDILKRDVNYKNPKIVKMLGEAKNSLVAFAVNSSVYSALTSKMDKAAANSEPVSFEDSVLSKLIKDVNIYGSINFDSGNASTSDITMSLGMIKDVVKDIELPKESANAAQNPGVDDSFDIAGYQVGKDIFYDLFNSFKAVQASVTFKFEKKKFARFVRDTPKIIDKILAIKSSPNSAETKTAAAKPNRIESVQDIVTTPQVYVDLARFLSSRGS